MKLRNWLIASSVLTALCRLSAYNVSSKGPYYAFDAANMGGAISILYATNLQNGSSSTVTSVSGTNILVSLGLTDSNTGYMLGLNTNKILAVNLQTGATRTVTPNALGSGISSSAIALANPTTAYVVAGGNDTIYSVNLQTGATSAVTSIPGTAGLADIVMATETTGYVLGITSGKIYEVNLQTGAYRIVNTTNFGSTLTCLALANNTTMYVGGSTGDNSIYALDLTTGNATLVAALSGNPRPQTLAISDDIVYATGLTGQIYGINTLNGTVFQAASLGSTATFAGGALCLQMRTNGLHGNNQIFAKYLNANAPFNIIRMFALTPQLASALESAAPTRNTFSTYAAQNASLAASQVLSDHGRQRRFHNQPIVKKSNDVATAIAKDELYAATKDTAYKTKNSEVKPECPKPIKYNIWLTPFGEYAREKGQQQTPAFSMGVGGAVLGFDYSCENKNVIGFAGAYAYTHIHESNSGGHANVNQGFLSLYGTWNPAKWYVDLGVWGSYYDSNNKRQITFPGVNRTASSNIRGWQVAPHLEIGYDSFVLKDCGVNWFGVEPFIMGDWVADWEHSLQETGAGNLNMGQKGRFCSFLRGEGGLRFHEVAKFNWGNIVFREKGSYAYQKAFHTGRITAFLVGSPGSFTVDTLTGAQNLGVIEVSMLALFKNPKAPYLDLRYQGEFGSHYQSHQGMLELGKNF